MALTITQLRSDLYKLIDEVIETGRPLRIERGGKTVLISVESTGSKFDALIERDVVEGDLDDLVHVEWGHEWDPFLP